MVRSESNLSKIIFITGGTKSGKSEFAEYLGRKLKKIPVICDEKNPKELVTVFKSIFNELDQVYQNMIAIIF